DVAVVQAADGDGPAGLVVAVVPDELGHRPRLRRRLVLPQPREVADQGLGQGGFSGPESGGQFPFFLPREQVRREYGRQGGFLKDNSAPLRRLALVTSRLHGRLSLLES